MIRIIAMSNVLLLISDEHNPFYSSVYGHPAMLTPNMEALASQGTTYTAYCPSPLCMPCRSAFLSGRRVHQIQTYSNCAVNVDRMIPSYGKVLSDQGIHAVTAGKSHVYRPTEDLGFTETLAAGEFNAIGDTENRRNPLKIRDNAANRANGFGPDDRTASGDRATVDAAIDWIKYKAPALDRAWVLAVNINNPHFPHVTPQKFWDLYPDGGDLPTHTGDCESANHPRALDLRKHFETDLFHEDQVRGLRRGYRGCVSFVDHQLGRMIMALKQSGCFDETNVIYTSDHGEMLGKFGMWWKCSLYEDSVRIPCIAAGPDYGSGRRNLTPIDLHDVQASIFASTGAERPSDWIGIPLQNLGEAEAFRIVFSEYHGHGARASSFMIRQGDWKYIHHIDAPHQLFNLNEDPDELSNVFDSDSSRAESMEGYLRQICDPAAENKRAENFINKQLEQVERHRSER